MVSPMSPSPSLIDEPDLALLDQAAHPRPWQVLGARVGRSAAQPGVFFALWAPGARRVSVVGDFCAWDARRWPMRRITAAGVWERFVPGLAAGATYKFAVLGADGRTRRKADPFGRAMELTPGTSSRVVAASRHRWADAAWMDGRRRVDWQRAPMNIYEVHLGSWRRGRDGVWLTYPELGRRLADHCRRLGFTHVELMPIAEHPYDGSWGYQVTGFHAPTSRFGTPDQLRAMVDHLHRSGIGVILDWVPAHFPQDDYALSRFDGTPLFEDPDPLRAAHPDWGTLVFDYASPWVRSFLIGNAHYWLEEFHLDGLRVDAVASMLYLDYSRKAGQWKPNRLGGNENLEAIDFIRELNVVTHAAMPGILTAAEESTAFPAVSGSAAGGGLGFDFKWDMGWMHDTLEYFARDPTYRRYHHRRLTFRGLYLGSERWILPLSHDEVVHEKRSLLGKMPGTEAQRFANLRSVLVNQFGQPGKKLLFMGSELAPPGEWNHDLQLPWRSGAQPLRAAFGRFVADLTALYLATPALWAGDADPSGFAWLAGTEPGSVAAAWIRQASPDEADAPIVVIQNLTAVAQRGYRLGLPRAGRWAEALNTDDIAYGGAGVTNPRPLETNPITANGRTDSLELDLPALGSILLRPISPQRRRA
jgi:1,4-alpha-glucan branching enzyme